MTITSGERRIATASYIENMLTELRSMGQQIECDLLVYLLEMAVIEASDIASGKIAVGRKSVPVVPVNHRPTAEELAARYMSGALDS